MSCLPPPPLSITAPSLSSVRAHARAWHWRGAPLGSLRVAAGDMRAPPAPSAEAYNCGALTSCLYGQRGQCCGAIAPCC